MKNRIYDTIYAAIDELNEQLSGVPKIKKDPKAVLFGKSGVLDSIGLVNLIVAVEQNIADEFDVDVSIADEKAMSQNSSPFKTIDTLTGYIMTILEEEKNE